jgi:ribonuclease E
MKKEMLINVLQPEECRIAILENGILEELYLERTSHESYVGNIYKGKIVNIEPSIQAAFVDFGVGRNGFLHVSDVEATYWRDVPPPRNGDRGGDRGERPDRGGRGADRGDRGRDRDRDRGDRDRSGRDRDRAPEVARPVEAAHSTPPEAAPPEVAAYEAPPRQSAPPAHHTGGGDFAAGIEFDQDVSRQPSSPPPSAPRHLEPEVLRATEPVSEPTQENDAPSLTAHPETRLEEEPATRRRSRSTGRRRRPAAEGKEPGEAAPEPSDEEPRPRLMDSAERRTERPESMPELHPSQGGAGDPEFSFPPANPFSPTEDHASRGEGAYAPMTEEPSAEEFRPRAPERERPATERGGRGRRRHVVDHRNIEDALEADLADAEIGQEAPTGGEILPGGEPADTQPEFDTRSAAQRRDGRSDGRNDSRGRGDRDRGPRNDRPRDDRPRSRDDRGPRNDRGPDQGPRRDSGPRNDRPPSGGGGMDRGRPGVYRPPIQEIFKRGQEVIVQVIKEGIGSKGPTLSTYISIPGRYLVLMPYLNRTGVSRKIEDEEARRRLRQMFNELKPPRDIGFIMRTAAIDKNKVEVQRDLVYLCRLWQVVAKRIKKLKGPVEIYQDSEMVTRTIRDNFSSDIDTIWVDEKNAFEAAQEFMQGVMPRYADRIQFYESKEPLFHKFAVEDEIARIQQKKVPLPQGGSIVIEQTEALVAIDVNSGNFRADSHNAEETAFQMNMHAAKEIARQLRLRDLGGVIVNDFIDMRDERHRRSVEKALRDAMVRDRARAKILRISQFGLIEMTRQRIRPGLKRSRYADCPHCKGNGMIKTPETMAIDVMRLIQLASCREEVARIEITVPLEVADFILNRARKALVQFEEHGQMTVTIRGGSVASGEHVEMRCIDRNDNEIRLVEPEPLPYRGPRFTR